MTSVRHVPYDGPGIVPDRLLEQDRPTRVCVLAGSELEIVGAEVLGPQEGVPLNLLLPACDGVVHDGAVDTTLTAAALGVPQLILGPRDRLLAERLAATGAGLLAGDTGGTVNTGDTIEAAALLGDGPRDAARRLRDAIVALPSPVDVVATVENLITKGGTQ